VIFTQRVTEVPQEAVFFFRQHFQIRHGGVQFRVPVHQAVAAVDQALVIQLDEHALHGGGEAGVHGEALAAPVQ
jgi:hypothetical protein